MSWKIHVQKAVLVCIFNRISFHSGCEKNINIFCILEGIFPNCICLNGKIYDHKHSICLEIDRSKCPKRSSGYPNCKCEEGYQLDNIHWYCRPWYLETITKVIYKTHSTCQEYYQWNGTECTRKHCPQNSIDPHQYYPNCTFGSIEINDNKAPPPLCSPGEIYSYPKCHKACEAFSELILSIASL